MKSLLLIGCISLFLPHLYAEKVPIEKAEKIAKSYTGSSAKLHSRKKFNLVRTVNRELQPQDQTLRRSGATREEAMYYVFGMDDNQGFIIVSADDVAVPVLGYSENGTYGEDNPNFNDWMDCLARGIAYAIENNLPQEAAIKEQWDVYLTGNAPGLRATTAVGPLLTTKWDQGVPYNDMCPIVGSVLSNGRAPVGCVATAMAQIMKYHNYPATRTVAIPAYTTKNQLQLLIPAITEATIYDWTSMTNTYNSSSTGESNKAVATLMFHCGASVNMVYNLSSSGAYTFDAGTALVDYFNYDQGLQHKYRRYYTDSVWNALLKAEIDAGRPIFYSRTDHAYVCDGYDNVGLFQYFHFNWGWGGDQDGYFTSTTGYTPSHEILINIKPSSIIGSGSYDIKIDDQTHISATKTTLDRGESFVVNAPVFNMGLFAFTGSIGVAIVDGEDNILSVIGQKLISNLKPGYSATPFTVSAKIPVSFTPGSYRIRVVYKPSDISQWFIATGTPGYIDELALTITGNPPLVTHNIVLASELRIIDMGMGMGTQYVNKGGVVSVMVNCRNLGAPITGDFGVALVDDGDQILEIIGRHYENYNLPAGDYSGYIIIPGGIGQTIAPGNYKIRVVFRPTGADWSILYGESSSIKDIATISVTGTITPDNSKVMMDMNFELTPDYSVNPINQFSPLTVKAHVVNIPEVIPNFFVGELDLGLYDSDGILQECIGKEFIAMLNSGNVGQYFIFNSSSVSLPRGVYYLSLYQTDVTGVRKKVISNGWNNDMEITVNGIPPGIISVTPAGVTNVSVEGTLSITFDKPMATAPGAGFVTLGGGYVSNEYKIWSSDRKTCTIAYTGLENGTIYTFNISDFRDASGNIMDEVTSGYAFKTAGVPTSVEGIAAGRVSVSNQGNTIHAVSAADNLIQAITVYTMQGVLIYDNPDINAPSYSFTVKNSLPEIYLVKIVTDNGVYSVKLIK